MIRNVACIGAGFVGGPLATVIACQCPDIQVTVVDKNKERIDAWNTATPPLYEPGLEDVLSRVRQRDAQCNLRFSTDIDRAIREAELIMLCIDTPTKGNGIGKGMALDLANTQAAVRTIAQAAESDKIIVEKSTVPCGTADKIRDLLESCSKNGCRFEVLSNPEFLAEGTSITDLFYPTKVLIGHRQTPSSRKAAEELAAIYSRWVSPELIIMMDRWSSELSKLAANAMLAQRISSINSLSAICEAVGADIDSVSASCGMDPRIGKGMLKSTLGWGGGCFEKDILCLVYLARSLGLTPVANYWASVIEMNEYQKSRFFMRIVSSMHGSVGGKSIAILGFAFKKNTSDTKNSAAIPLVRNLLQEGALVSIYDPMVPPDRILIDVSAAGSHSASVQVCPSAYEACNGVDAVVIATEWDEFQTPIPTGDVRMTTAKDTRIEEPQSPPSTPGDKGRRLDWEWIMNRMRSPRFIFDGRNILDRQYLEQLGARYIGIGSGSEWGFLERATHSL
ncbi:UDP-glucose/GDP-mannose dehydrogenase family, NAD binding domain-containing protein [Aspergillus caelatus]|uniref:UDP-glucose 6-dehydrogenase n=1 Tax=Aspergillus caelatus TaxID=61420 RepID=A0A5N7AFS5_9EURO|nr:UDP-glucose/GDP-mannose dehydrogenase family, NAD binding domain-containing protein [Aspergillus caelatus]KAE8368672.1 UDP-glucose/GDP-mannose dehydrogenase family, NAD binding domain-containing protein [Aspergillus caelatus]